ncbi:MAG: acetate--CoA ligase family protein [Desulfobacterales bacterium]|jgi:acyl-CoA synthetase (NDP forming)
MDLLAPPTVRAIDKILEGAWGQGRSALFEHEVYRILDLLGLETPMAEFIPAGTEISAQKLSRFTSDTLVIKIVSPRLAHKMAVNGVRIVHRDLDFLRYSCERLQKEVAAQGHDVEGVLLVDHVVYTKDLGNEVLLGFRESDAFGPVISFSKGGADAEHFAEHFSPPNLILAPIDEPWARALLQSTKIYKKYLKEARRRHVDLLVQTGVQFSRLAMCFSSFFPQSSGFILKEFEINPFVFDPHGRFVALDGFATIARRPDQRPQTPPQDLDRLTPFFEPQGLAVIGISRTDRTKPGNIIFENLVRLGRQDVFGVSIKGGAIELAGQTRPLYASVADIDAPVDLAVVAVPADQSIAVVEDCARKSVRALILIPGGFSETSKDQTLEQEILQMTRRHGIRVIGPNCLGIIYSGNDRTDGINTFFVPEEKFRINLEKDNNVAILSQSGALGITEIYNLRNAISPKVIVSYGNQLDVDPADLVAYFDRDPEVDVIGCYIEGFKAAGGRKFFNTACQTNTPIVVYKAGRTEAGKQATESHTASIAGEYEVAKAAMKQAGLIVAETMIDHGDFIKTFALLSDFKVRGNRVALIANAGYEKTDAADNLGRLQIASFDPATRDRLAKLLPPYVNVDPLLDLTPMAGDAMYADCIRTMLQSEAIDALMISIVPHSILLHTTDDEIAQTEDHLANRIVQLVQAFKKPTVVSVNVAFGAGAVYNRFGQILDSGGVPTFLTANRAMICLNAFVRYRLTRHRQYRDEWLT